MPDFVPVSGSIEFRITGLHTSGKKVYNIGHVACASPFPTLSEVTQVAVVVGNWCDISYYNMYNSTIRIVEVRARSNAQEPGPVYIDTTPNVAGTLAGDPLPLAQSLCINLVTGLTGPSQRGRWFTFPADETTQTLGVYNVTYKNFMETSLAALQADLQSGGFDLAIESRRHLALYPITGYVGQIIPSTLASRKPNRGI